MVVRFSSTTECFIKELKSREKQSILLIKIYYRDNSVFMKKISFAKTILHFIFILLAATVESKDRNFYDFSPPAEQTDIPHKINFGFLKTKGTIGGWLQLDKNWFLHSPVPTKQHIIRRLRLYCTTTSRDLLTIMFMGQGDQDKWQYHYIYGDVLKPSFFKVRFGLCKKPFGLEALYSSRYLWMVNRSLGSINYLTIRDIGIGPHGALFQDTVQYGMGVFNGNGDNLKNNPNKVFCGRFVWIPWNNLNHSSLQRLRFGSSFSTCQKLEKLSGTFFETGSETPFLTWTGSNTRSKTGKTLLGGDIEWLFGPWALRGEFLLVNWGKVSNQVISTPFSGYSWYVESSYLLTGEKQPRNAPLFPTENFSFCRGGGACEVLGRYEAFQADQKADTGWIG